MKRRLRGEVCVIIQWGLLCLSIGCVSTTLQVPSDHPARPSAPSGRIADNPGAVLDVEAPPVPRKSVAVGSPRESASASRSQSDAPDGTRQAPYVGEGEIQRVGKGELEIRHGPIPGFMAAMTMTFATSQEVKDGDLKAGDMVRFKIESHPDHGYRIFSVEPVSAEADGASGRDHANENLPPHTSEP